MRTYDSIVVMDDGDDIHDVIEASPEGARILLPAVVDTTGTIRPKKGQHLQGLSPGCTVVNYTRTADEASFAAALDVTITGMRP